MSNIPTVFFAAFDQSQIDNFRILKGKIQGNQEVTVYDFADVANPKLYKKLPTYADKLKKVLNDAKLAILLSPSDPGAIQSPEKLVEVIKAVYNVALDDNSSKLFLDFIKIESDDALENSKLVFFSLGEAALPESFAKIDHAQNMLVNDTVNEDEIRRVLTKCKRAPRISFPEGDKKKNKGDKDCMLM